jgi:hypothetical protein
MLLWCESPSTCSRSFCLSYVPVLTAKKKNDESSVLDSSFIVNFAQNISVHSDTIKENYLLYSDGVMGDISAFCS